MKNVLVIFFLLIVFNFSSYSQAFLGIGYKAGQVKLNDTNSKFSKTITILLVTDVVENSPAQKAGILKNDFIASLNKKDILSSEDFQVALSKLSPKDTITLLIQRDSIRFYKKIILGSPPIDLKINNNSQSNGLSEYEKLENEFKSTSNPEKKLKILEEMGAILKNTNMYSNSMKDEKYKALEVIDSSKKKLRDIIEATNLLEKIEQEFKSSDNTGQKLKLIEELERFIFNSNWTKLEKQEAIAKIKPFKNQAIESTKFKKRIYELNENIYGPVEEKDNNGRIVSSRLLKYFNVNDKKLILRILNNEFNLDPQNKDWRPCGTVLDKCKYCNKTIRVNANYRSTGNLIKSLHTLPFLALNEKNINEIKNYLGQMRSGSFYACLTDGTNSFCSQEHRYLFSVNK